MKRNIMLTACLFVVLLIVPTTSMADLIASMEQIAPVPTEYTLIDDFFPFSNTAVGDVTAFLQYVGLGNLESDFAGFLPGNIALMERGGALFQQKVENAFAAGATGALIFDTNFQDDAILGILLEPPLIPALFITRDVGLDLLSLADWGVAIHMVTYTSSPTAIPEPGTLLLLGTGLAGMALYKRFGKR